MAGKHRKDDKQPPKQPQRKYQRCGNCNGTGSIIVNKKRIVCGVCGGRGSY